MHEQPAVGGVEGAIVAAELPAGSARIPGWY